MFFVDCYQGNDPNNLKANHTITFKSLWDETMYCFQNYYKFDSITTSKNYWPWDLDGMELGKIKKILKNQGSLCNNCSKVYNKMRNYFWENVVPSNEYETLGGVCYDIRDAVSTKFRALHFTFFGKFLENFANFPKMKKF